VEEQLNGEIVDWLNGKDELKTDNYLTAEDAKYAEENRKEGKGKTTY